MLLEILDRIFFSKFCLHFFQVFELRNSSCSSAFSLLCVRKLLIVSDRINPKPLNLEGGPEIFPGVYFNDICLHYDK